MANKKIIFSIITTITLTGYALNIGGHAAVVSANKDVYYVDGLEGWEQGWVGRTVRITGDLMDRDDSQSGYTTGRVLNHHPAGIIKTALVILVDKQ